MNNYKIYSLSSYSLSSISRFLLLASCFLLLTSCFFLSCARKGDPVIPEAPKPKKYIKVTLKIIGEINSRDVIYTVVFDIDNDTGDGPIANRLIRDKVVPEVRYVKLENDMFTFHRKYIKNGDILSEYLGRPFRGEIKDRTIEVIVAHEKLDNIPNLSINCITYDRTHNPIDAIGSIDTDENVVDINVNIESYKSFTDDTDDLEEDKASFNIKGGKVKVFIK